MMEDGVSTKKLNDASTILLEMTSDGTVGDGVTSRVVGGVWTREGVCSKLCLGVNVLIPKVNSEVGIGTNSDPDVADNDIKSDIGGRSHDNRCEFRWC